MLFNEVTLSLNIHKQNHDFVSNTKIIVRIAVYVNAAIFLLSSKYLQIRAGVPRGPVHLPKFYDILFLSALGGG